MIYYITLYLEDEDEYIERLDSYIQKNKLNKQSAFWPPERFGITILDWMRRDGVFSD